MYTHIIDNGKEENRTDRQRIYPAVAEAGQVRCVAGERYGNRRDGPGADDQEKRPAVEEGGQRAKSVPEIHVPAAGLRAVRSQLGKTERSRQGNHAAEYPHTDGECRGSDPLCDDRRVQKNSCAHYATHDEHGAIEDTEAAGVRGGVGRARRPRFLSVRQLVFQSPRVRGRAKSS